MVTAAEVQGHPKAVAALSNAAVRADTALGVSGAILLVILIVSVAARRLAIARPILEWGTILSATMLLTGAVRGMPHAGPSSFCCWHWPDGVFP